MVTEEEKLTRADVVFVGRVIATKAAPKLHEVTHGLSPYWVTVAVEKWVKGSGSGTVELVDTPGTNCDPVFGLFHIVSESHPDQGRWKVFARRSQGYLVVYTAERIN